MEHLRKDHRKKIDAEHDRYGRFSIPVLLFLIVVCQGLKASEDSLRKKYDLNDPRNPNCPCHKYQKMANEEYSRLLREQGELNKDKKLMSEQDKMVVVKIKKRRAVFCKKKVSKRKKFREGRTSKCPN